MSQAYLCAVRIIRKVPELYENFVGRAKNVFQERNHATLLTGLTLIQELLHVDPSLVEQFRSVRRCSKLLKHPTTRPLTRPRASLWRK